MTKVPATAGTVGVLTSEQGRFSRFWTAMISTQLPPRTKLIVKMSLNIPEARNEVLTEAEGDWVWFMDDDHTFHPNLLMNLLARNVDIIQPLVLQRYTPFGPVVMGPPDDTGKKHWRYALTDGVDTTGLKEVNIAGCAGMLIRRYVWEAMDKPYFSMGRFSSEVVAEDVDFCLKAREKGFKVYCDLDNRMGHLNIGEVWPDKHEGKWVTRLIYGNETIIIPAAAPKRRINTKTGEVFNLEDKEEEQS